MPYHQPGKILGYRALILFVLLLIVLPLLYSSTRAQETNRTFPETGKTVSGIFLQYWNTHGGLSQQGYPISDEMTLKSTDGKEYTTQFFERAVFELHPEFADTQNEVLLKLVGQTFYDRHFGTAAPPNQTINPENTLTFPETGHSLGGKFRVYWEQHGGLAQQGFPMTDEFTTTSTDGKQYTTQVFQRAVFELHPEFAGTVNEVLLRLLGVEEWAELNRPLSNPTQTVQVPATASPTAFPNDQLIRTVNGIDYEHTIKKGNEHIVIVLDNTDAQKNSITPGTVRFNPDLLADLDKTIQIVAAPGVTRPTLISEGISDEGPSGFEEGYNTLGIDDQIIFYRWDGHNMLYKWAKGWETKQNDVSAKLEAAGKLTRTFILTIASRDGKQWALSDLYNFMGDTPETRRLFHNMGYTITGVDPSFDEAPWPTFLQVSIP